MRTDKPVWLVTGCSSGFGAALADVLAARGDRLVATARDATRLMADLRQAGPHVLTVDLDVTKAATVAEAITQAQARFGRIDVLVNNAGYGYQASVEEGDETEIRAQFDANVFGLFAVTRAVLPGMRARRRGHIINITSVAGLIGFPGSGYYAASKHAVEGWSDALLAEVAPLGIKVTCVEPGPFRTDWAGRSLKQTPNVIADYADTAGTRLKATADNSGTQAGDPIRAARAMIDIVDEPDPPRHLVLGAWGVAAVAERLEARSAEFDRWRAVGLGTDFPT